MLNEQYDLKQIPFNKDVLVIDIYGTYDVGFFTMHKDNQHLLFNSYMFGLRFWGTDEYSCKYIKLMDDIIDDYKMVLDDNINIIDDNNFIAKMNSHYLKFNIGEKTYKLIEIDDKKVELDEILLSEIPNEDKNNLHYYAWLYIKYKNKYIRKYLEKI